MNDDMNCSNRSPFFEITFEIIAKPHNLFFKQRGLGNRGLSKKAKKTSGFISCLSWRLKRRDAAKAIASIPSLMLRDGLRVLA
ncbi:MAG: hypothetical protein V3V20_12185 [Algisphaera sp.]